MTHNKYPGLRMEEIDKIKYNIETVKENICEACMKANRDPEEIVLLAATKTVSSDAINLAIDSGISCIGENRAQELISKYDKINKKSCEIHFIGHLQRNKVKQIIDKVTMIHSVDNIELAKEIAVNASKNDKIMDILVEVNIANEATKGGINPLEVENFIKQLSEIKHIKVRGLMTIPPNCQEKYKTIGYFKKMQQIWIDIKGKNMDNISMDCLSMGMSSDYTEAVCMGSTLVRVGRAIFGERAR